MATIQPKKGVFDAVFGFSIGRVTNATYLVALLIVIGTLTSCTATGQDAGASELRDTSWTVTSLSGSALLPGTTITLEFTESELSGSAGCNRYSAGYQLTGDTLSVGEIAATEMACPEPVGILEQEGAYLAALRAADSYQVVNERLAFMDASGEQVLSFVPAAGEPVSRPDAPPNEAVAIQNATATPVSRATPTAAAATPTTAAATATPVATTETVDPPPGLQLYEDELIGVALLLPDSWTVAHVLPGQSAILQSYPEDKYVGGEARDPGDTKCDLTIRPADIDLAGHMDQVRADPTITIVSEDEITLASGSPGLSLELESMGSSRSLVTVVNERVVVLTCWGEEAPFDELALSIR